ncbi:MAG: CoA-binding protein [Candidatus Lokiarchaeota archaeon]
MNLEPFFNPKSVVIIGVSRKEFTFNYTILKNLLEIFYRGKIYILNPNADEILGIKSYDSLEELPEVPELAIIVLGRNVAGMFRELGEFGIKYIVIESDLTLDQNGDLKTSFDEESVKKNLNSIARNYGITYIGPSTIGLINYINNFTTSIIPVRQHIMKKNRNISSGVSYIAQSGGLAGALGWWAPSQDLPIVKVIHLGHAYDIEESDVIDYFVKDETTKIILLFLRGINQKLIDAVRKCAPIKPVLFFYVGKDNKSADLLKEAGGIAVRNYIELFEISKVFLWCAKPEGPNLGLIGPSSGAIYIIAKEMRKQYLNLAKLANESRRNIIEKVGGSTCITGNPVDYWPPERFIGTKICEIYNASSKTLLNDNAVNGLILALEFFIEIEFDFLLFLSSLEPHHLHVFWKEHRFFHHNHIGIQQIDKIGIYPSN